MKKQYRFRLKMVDGDWLVFSYMPTRKATPCEVYLWMRLKSQRKAHRKSREEK